MSEQSKLTTLQRKAGAGRSPLDAAGMTPPKALKLAFLKAAQAELRLAARAESIHETRHSHAKVIENIDENLLILTLDGPSGSMGFLLVDTQVLAGIIEIQTLGFVKNNAAEPRKATNTDRAMIKPVINLCLNKFADFLTGGPAQSWTAGFCVGERIENVRLLGLRLDDIEFRRLTVSLDLGDGAKQGEISFVFPAVGNKIDADLPERDWTSDLQEAVLDSHGMLNAILHKTLHPLAKVRGFQVGDLIEVPISAVSQISMEGVDGQIVGKAKLGQQNGFRALRVVVGDDTAVVAPSGSQPAQTMPDLEPDAPAPDDFPAMGNAETANLAMNTDLADLPDMNIATDDAGLPDIGMAPMGDLPDLADIATDDLEMEPLATMPMDMAIGID